MGATVSKCKRSRAGRVRVRGKGHKNGRRCPTGFMVLDKERGGGGDIR